MHVIEVMQFIMGAKQALQMCLDFGSQSEEGDKVGKGG
jgi:hypothetical protein